MPSDRCLCWAAALLCAVLASASMGTKSLASGRCFQFQSYDSGNATVELRNTCSEHRVAAIQFCDGYSFPVTVPAGGMRRVRAFPGCIMRVTAERSFGTPSSSRATRQRRGRPTISSKDGGAVRQGHQSPAQDLLQHQAAPSGSNTHGNSKPGGFDTHPPLNGPAASPSLNGDAVTAKNRSALNLQQAAPAAKIEPLKRSPVWKAVFPGTSDQEWEILSCSVSGQTLIREAEALLTRKEVLHVLLVEIWFSTDADKKQDEWTAAQKEFQAIERELGLFENRAKAIIVERAAN